MVYRRGCLGAAAWMWGWRALCSVGMDGIGISWVLSRPSAACFYLSGSSSEGRLPGILRFKVYSVFLSLWLCCDHGTEVRDLSQELPKKTLILWSALTLRSAAFSRVCVCVCVCVCASVVSRGA
jgi:hypothetical protein